jgi:Zn-dependent protease with chaperone function
MSALWVAITLVGVIAVVFAVARPAATTRAPRLGATVELLTLAAIGLMPPLLFVCAAATWGTASGSSGHMVAGVCVLANGTIGPAQLALYALAGVLLVRTGVLAVRTVRASQRAELNGLALDHAIPRALPDGETAWILPSERLAAYSGGLRHPRAVVTTGLLDLLDPDEQDAVLRHEVAHLRLGHPRIVVLGGVVARAYRWLPPARMAWTRLRRELEAAADDEVVAAIGADPLLRALAKVALAETPPATAGFAEPRDLRYRIRRLQEPRPRRARASLALGVAGAVIIAALASATCQALHAGISLSSVIPCLVGFGYLGWRPTWARRLRAPATRIHGA